VPGLSERLLRSHWENNYCGAVKALNAVELRLAAMLDDADLPPYVYGDLKREELLRTGSVRLHELYFGHLGGDGCAGADMERVLARAFSRSATPWA
jgi:Fe-Mn family superoxide dismutase